MRGRAGGCAIFAPLTIPLALLISCTGTIGPACGSKAGGAVPGSSMRILTFNTALFSPIFQCGRPDPINGHPDLSCYLFNPLGDYIEERANDIADRISIDRYDVVAFNEVWDEDDGKDVMWSRLCESYPNYVKYVDVFGGGIEEDSGLMLFSRLAFDALPDGHFKSEDNESSLGDDSDRIAYVKFDECEDNDCLAAKGAILVRLKHPTAGRIINVVATHMQADYGGPSFDSVRSKQLRQIRGQCETGQPSTHPNLIHKTLAPSLAPSEGLCNWSNSQWLVMIGDLNIPGAGAVGEALHPASAPCKGRPVSCNPKDWGTSGCGCTAGEWQAKIGGPAAKDIPRKIPFYDAWGETTSEVDVGMSAGDSQRLDYILASQRTAESSGAGSQREPCVQHVWSPPEFEGLSDHRPVAADLNLQAPQCNPRTAETPTENEMGALGVVEKEATKFHRKLTHPGSMQWWRIDNGGTYAIAIDPDAKPHGVSLEVYAADNLSQPLKGAYELDTDVINACDYSQDRRREPRCDEVEAQKFVLPKGPFYIRVFSTDRAWSGQHWIAFHHYNCKSIEEACDLLPNAPAPFIFPAATPLNPDDMAFFRVPIQEQADSGNRQQLRFFAENDAAAAWTQPTVTLADANGTPVSDVDGQTLAGPIASVTPAGRARVALEGSTKTDGVFFFRVRRADVKASLTLRVGWQTNLVLVGGSSVGPKPAKLVCEDETNPEWGADEIWLTVNVDGTGWQSRGDASFDCDNQAHPRNWEAIGVVRLLDAVKIRLDEDDDINNNDTANANSAPNPAWAMDMEVFAPARHETWWKFEGGSYRFTFNVSKWRVQ